MNDFIVEVMRSPYWPAVNFIMNVACIALCSWVIWGQYVIDKRIDIMLHKELIEDCNYLKDTGKSSADIGRNKK
jgi:hypothetical protein